MPGTRHGYSTFLSAVALEVWSGVGNALYLDDTELEKTHGGSGTLVSRDSGHNS